MNDNCSICNKLKPYNFGNFVHETSHWIIFLAPNQSNLGTCVIALNRHHKTLAGLKNSEWKEFSQLVETMEAGVKKAFNATLVNWGCLMNSFYLDDKPEPHIHWHFIPRYREPVNFAGTSFEDPHFGHMRPRPPKNLPENVKEQIKNKISEFFLEPYPE